MNSVGIRLHDVEGVGIEEKINEAYRQGFKCVHLAVNKIESNFKIELLDKCYSNKLKKLLNEKKMTLAILGCYKNLAHPSDKQLKKIKEQYYRHIDFVAMMNQGIVGTETGCPNAEYKWDKDTHSEPALQFFIEQLKYVVNYAEEKGVIIAIEPVYKHIVHSSKVARRVLDEIDSTSLKIIFDPVNLLSITNIEYREHIFKEAIELLGKDIVAVHIKDYYIEDGEIKATCCGLGEMNFDIVTSFLANHRDIPITLENTTADNAEKARLFLQQKIDTNNII